jgi:hypothetical protein
MSYQPPDARPPHQQPPVVAGWQPAPMPPAAPPEPKSRVIPVLLGVLAVSVVAVGGLIAALLNGGKHAAVPPAGSVAGVTATTEAPATEAAVVAAPAPADFRLTAKITDKQCFGSAGCNVTFRVDVTYAGTAALDPDKTWLVIYEINGIEDAPQVGNFQLTGTRVESTDEDVQTSSTKSKITLKATSVEAN